MAPVQNSPKPLKSALKKTSHPLPSKSTSLFSNTKKDKRIIKHANLMSRVTKSQTTKTRRRRPNKKLVATLDSLADALPENDTENSTAAAAAVKDQVNVIKRKSMKSRPGAMKRREKIDAAERERFAKNMAQMAAPSSTGASGLAAKLAALRGFISQTLEVRPELQRAES